MAYENIKLKYANFTINGGYFFTFTHTNDVMYKKNTRGNTVFTYPLDTSLSNIPVLEVCCDGINFWTLQAGSTATVSNVRVIRKWRIDRNICKLINTFTFGNATEYFTSDTFAIEASCDYLLDDILSGSTYLTLSPTFSQEVPAGTVLTIGPNSDGFCEEVTVTGTIFSNTFGLDFYTSLDHSAGEAVSFVTNLWLFNNYKGVVLSPLLLRYNLINCEFDYSLVDPSFTSMGSSTFYRDAENTNYILYVYGTALKFFNVDQKETVKSFTMDNIRVDGSTVIPIYGLEVENDTLYRLQNYMKYFEVNYSMSTYNYQCSTLRPFVDSISMEVYPKILPANGVSEATVTTIIQDQYGDPAQYKVAHISDDDSSGYLTITTPLTNLQGVAISYYRAGLSVRSATITALATQYD